MAIRNPKIILFILSCLPLCNTKTTIYKYQIKSYANNYSLREVDYTINTWLLLIDFSKSIISIQNQYLHWLSREPHAILRTLQTNHFQSNLQMMHFHLYLYSDLAYYPRRHFYCNPVTVSMLRIQIRNQNRTSLVSRTGYCS